MVDRLPPTRRSWLMSRVGAKDTKPELAVRSIAHSLGYRFRLHRSDLPGKPDLVFPKKSIVIFVHGCFWHRHTNCSKASTPKTRVRFWNEKFRRNVERDALAISALRKLGWKTVIIWECQTRDKNALAARLKRVLD